MSSPQDDKYYVISNDKYYVISKSDDFTIQTKLLKTKHNVAGGRYELFDLEDESDDTRRIMDLIPMIVDFFGGENVFVVDVVERILHPNLVRYFFEFILYKCAGLKASL